MASDRGVMLLDTEFGRDATPTRRLLEHPGASLAAALDDGAVWADPLAHEAPGLPSQGTPSKGVSDDELLIPLFLSGTEVQTLTARIWNSLLLEVDPAIAVVSSFLIAITCAVLRRKGEIR